MKIAAHQVSTALKSNSGYAGLLVFGEDWGLVRERALTALRGALGGDTSPFRLATLTREEHSRLRDEAGSRTLGGGRRVIHVQDAGDGLVGQLEKLDLRATDILLVLEAGELPARSKLRAYAEKHAAWGAVACYASGAGAVASEIKAHLASAGLTAEPDALQFLSQELAGESLTRRSELDKLALFAADTGTVDIETARQCCSVSLDTSLGAAVGAALSGRPALCDTLLAELEREGATGAGLLAVLSGQMLRLLKVRLMIDEGQSAEAACRSLMPPLYPRQAEAFMQDVQRWRAAALEGLGQAIRTADTACKRAASPDFAIASRLLMAVASRRGP